MDVRSYRGSTIDSDHYLVIAWLRAQISNVKEVTDNGTSKYSVSKLTSTEVVEQYMQLIEEKLDCITLTERDNGEELWERCKTVILQLKRCWASWNQQIKEYGWMMNARLP
jgi:hypothetical protein